MSVEEDLLDISSKRPLWQQDLLRRVCVHPELTPEDLDEVYSNLKATQGLAARSSLSPLGSVHLSARTGRHADATKLLEISNVTNANQLAKGQSLSFNPNGLTIVFGYNGSGKTGYTRILKRLCRTRHERTEPILGNVYATAASGPAAARIRFLTGATEKTIDWTDGQPAPPELAQLSVFDALTAPLYANQQNKIDFLPYGLDVLPRFGRACEQLATKIGAECATVATQLRQPPPAYDGLKGDVIQRLAFGTPERRVPTEAEIDAVCKWNAVDDEAIIALEKDIAKISAPAQRAASLRRVQVAIESVFKELTNVRSAVSDSEAKRLNAALRKAQSTREAAEIAAKGHFVGDPLEAYVGSDAWKSLMRYAEEFNKVAYPGEAFPATGEGKVCLLCQQELSEEAGERLQRFHKFLADSSMKDASAAAEEVSEIAKALQKVKCPTEEHIRMVLGELLQVDPEFQRIIDNVCSHSKSLSADLVACLGSFQVGRDVACTATPEDFLAELQLLKGALEDEAKKMDQATQDTSQLAGLRSDHADRLARKRCHQDASVLKNRRESLSHHFKLERCKSGCDTTQISRKASELREKYLTKGFQERIQREVEFIGLQYLPITVQGRTEKGRSYMGVALNSPRADASKVLSEGEFRGLALACFFAEIGNIPGHDGIIVDDPVSSLDHLHIERIATRLINETQVRPQVIVFTHDIGFYYELWMVAEKAGVAVHRHWIHNVGDRFGVVSPNDGPWQAKSTSDRLGELKQILQNFPDQHETTPDQYLKAVEAFYSKLRETWERLVEERLLNKVVGRFQPGVSTQSLQQVSVTDDDYRAVFFGMKKASEYSGHDRPPGRSVSPPAKKILADDLNALCDYDAELKKRQEVMKKSRPRLG